MVSVQKRFTRDLCIPVVLMCLELFSKRTKVTIIQITNYNSIELVCILAKKEKIPKGLSFIHTSNLLSAKENYAFFHNKIFLLQLATGGIESVFYKNMMAPFKNDLPPRF